MPVLKLSPGLVRSARCQTGRKLDLFDSQRRGLLLEVRSTGGKTYFARYTNERGRERHIKIGPADIITLAQARRKATRILAKVILGEDLQQKRHELRQAPRFDEFVETTFVPFLRASKRSWQTDETMLRCHIAPRLGSLFLDEIEARHVGLVLEAMKAAGYATGTLNRALIVIRHALRLARKWGKLPAEASNPTAAFRCAPDVQRQTFLSTDEIGRLQEALDEEAINPNAANAIRLLLLTGARRNEVLQARWANIDFANRILRVPYSKSGRARVVILNDSAMELLRGLPRHNEYLFALEKTGKPPASLFFPWDRVRKRAGLSGVRLHDLRHTFASVLVNNGVSLYVVQKLLGHAHAKATQRYAHLSEITLKEAAATFQRSIQRDLGTKMRPLPGSVCPV